MTEIVETTKPKKKYNYTKKTGRPAKLDSINLNKIKKLVLSGWDDAQVSDFFGFTPQTFCNYKLKHQKFFESLKEWKKEADQKVERSLYERALGYSHSAVKMFVIGGKVVTQEYVEHYPPSEVACIFWLKNRQPQAWRDKQDVEHSGSIELSAKNIIAAVEEAESKAINRVTTPSAN